jgi:hypothetical protein
MRDLGIALLVAAGLGGASSIAPADELPRTGKVKLQISQLQYSSEDLRLDHDTGFGNVEFAGVTRNVDGKSWFDRMTERCTGQYYVAETGAPPPNGACLYTDIYGDCMVVAYRGTAQRAGVQRIIGGTGRYAGIFGQGTYTATKLRSPTVGLEFWLTDVELEYELDRSSP